MAPLFVITYISDIVIGEPGKGARPGMVVLKRIWCTVGMGEQ